MPEIESKTVDLILTDPPFDVLEISRDVLGDLDMKKLSEEFYRILKGDAKVLIFCAIHQIPKWTAALTGSGLKVLPMPIFVIFHHSGYFNIFNI